MLSSLFLSTHQATTEMVCDWMVCRGTSGQGCLKYLGIRYTDQLYKASFLSGNIYIPNAGVDSVQRFAFAIGPCNALQLDMILVSL